MVYHLYHIYHFYYVGNKLKLQDSAKEFLRQINEAISLSPHYADGMSAILIGDGGVAIQKDGTVLNTPIAKALLTTAILTF